MKFTFPMLDGALPLWVRLEAHTRSDEWVISGIELYRDDSYSDASLCADDIAFDSLPSDSQSQLIYWIEQAYKNRRPRENWEVMAEAMDKIMGSFHR
jgi:hypothetical protein